MWKRHLPRVRDRSEALKVRHINLLPAMGFSLAGAIVIAIAVAWVLAPWLNVGTQKTSPADLTRLALTIAAGVGGVVALVVAYRRQRDLEQGRFVEGFGAAAKQLGDADVAVRLAGVYAMAGVADQTSKLKRQQCIDVLCGYLRMPYSPELGSNHQSARTLKKPVLREGGLEEELHFRYRQNDQEVRKTIVRVIATHLQRKSEHSWSFNHFDFTGSHLEGPGFRGASFNGDALFTGATFSGDTSFEEAIFSRDTSFEKAIFSRDASFEKASFSGDTSFEEATFSGRKNTSFSSATFSGYTSFANAAFSSEDTSFDGATFSGDALFDGATFDGETWFSSVTFSGTQTVFARANFRGRTIVFAGAIFSGSQSWFNDATFSGKRTTFEGATFSGREALFLDATFSGAEVEFDNATFSAAVETSFRGVTFGAAKTTFAEATFSGGSITFENPNLWDPAPTFDWDSANEPLTLKPANVLPQNWPPVTRANGRIPLPRNWPLVTRPKGWKPRSDP